MSSTAGQGAPALDCRPGATDTEIRAAYRAALRRARPDLDGVAGHQVDREWVARLQAARDELLRTAPRDRRRRTRRGEPPVAYLRLRRSTWSPDPQAPTAVDLRL